MESAKKGDLERHVGETTRQSMTRTLAKERNGGQKSRAR